MASSLHHSSPHLPNRPLPLTRRTKQRMWLELVQGGVCSGKVRQQQWRIGLELNMLKQAHALLQHSRVQRQILWQTAPANQFFFVSFNTWVLSRSFSPIPTPGHPS